MRITINSNMFYLFIFLFFLFWKRTGGSFEINCVGIVSKDTDSIVKLKEIDIEGSWGLVRHTKTSHQNTTK